MQFKSGFKKGLEGALARYQFMAIWSGSWSILLWFIAVPATSFFHSKLFIFAAIAIIHGFTYPIYVIAAFEYCLKARKNLLVTLIYIAAGTLPIASFIAEKKATADFHKR